MIVEHTLNRSPTREETTFGEWLIDGVKECYTLEDEIRELPGVPVEQWKIHGKTAIPAGRYRLTLENSNRFGPDTITISPVPGFVGIRVHGGNTAADTDGCPIVGDEISNGDPNATHPVRRIGGAQTHGVLAKLKAKIKASIAAGNEQWITVKNPEGT